MSCTDTRLTLNNAIKSYLLMQHGEIHINESIER